MGKVFVMSAGEKGGCPRILIDSKKAGLRDDYDGQGLLIGKGLIKKITKLDKP